MAAATATTSAVVGEGRPRPIPGRFKGKTVLVTGAGGNFGKACAERMGLEGANVVLTDVNEAALSATHASLTALGVPSVAIPADVTNASDVDNLLLRATSRFPVIDLCFNNAGYQGLFTTVDKYPLDDFRKVLDVNVTGVFNVLRAVSQHLREKNRAGAIVNTASMAGVTGPPNMPAYAASKAAVVGLTKTAARDVAPLHIRVNAVSPAFIGPGFMWTRQTELQAAAGSQYYDKDPDVVAQQMVGSVPLRRLGSVEEVVGVVTFLLSDDASYLTGVNIEVTGGI